MGTTNADEWSVLYPANAEMVAQGAAEIRFLKTAIGQRLLKEHIALAAGNAGGEHKAGSAMIYIEDYEGDPDTNLTERPDGTTFTVTDLGRICYDTSDNNFYILTDHSPITWTLYPPADRFALGTLTSDDSEDAALVKDEVYKVGSDGFITAYTDATNYTLYGKVGDSDPPDVYINKMVGGYATASIMFPVKKDTYFMIESTGTPIIYWSPFGSGTCEIQE